MKFTSINSESKLLRFRDHLSDTIANFLGSGLKASKRDLLAAKVLGFDNFQNAIKSINQQAPEDINHEAYLDIIRQMKVFLSDMRTMLNLPEAHIVDGKTLPGSVLALWEIHFLIAVHITLYLSALENDEIEVPIDELKNIVEYKLISDVNKVVDILIENEFSGEGDRMERDIVKDWSNRAYEKYHEAVDPSKKEVFALCVKRQYESVDIALSKVPNLNRIKIIADVTEITLFLTMAANMGCFYVFKGIDLDSGDDAINCIGATGELIKLVGKNYLENIL